MWFLSFFMDGVLIPKISLDNGNALALYVLLTLYMVKRWLASERNREPIAIQGTFIIWLVTLLGLAVSNSDVSKALLHRSSILLYFLFVIMITITSVILKKPFTWAYLEDQINSGSEIAKLVKKAGLELSYVWALMFLCLAMIDQLAKPHFRVLIPIISIVSMLKWGNRAFVKMRINQALTRKAAIS
jgi:hypothetical protein